MIIEATRLSCDDLLLSPSSLDKSASTFSPAFSQPFSSPFLSPVKSKHWKIFFSRTSNFHITKKFLKWKSILSSECFFFVREKLNMKNDPVNWQHFSPLSSSHTQCSECITFAYLCPRDELRTCCLLSETMPSRLLSRHQSKKLSAVVAFQSTEVQFNQFSRFSPEPGSGGEEKDKDCGKSSEMKRKRISVSLERSKNVQKAG